MENAPRSNNFIYVCPICKVKLSDASGWRMHMFKSHNKRDSPSLSIAMAASRRPDNLSDVEPDTQATDGSLSFPTSGQRSRSRSRSSHVTDPVKIAASDAVPVRVPMHSDSRKFPVASIPLPKSKLTPVSTTPQPPVVIIDDDSGPAVSAPVSVSATLPASAVYRPSLHVVRAVDIIRAIKSSPNQGSVGVSEFLRNLGSMELSTDLMPRVAVGLAARRDVAASITNILTSGSSESLSLLIGALYKLRDELLAQPEPLPFE